MWTTSNVDHKEKVEHKENRSVTEGVNYFTDAGNRNYWYLGDPVQFMVID